MESLIPDEPDDDRPAFGPDPLADAAFDSFGVGYLFPYQRLVVSNVLEGRNQIVVLPTGAGKSFCFLLPAALLEGLTIVVYPLRSLIADQARRLSTGKVAAEPLTGETPKNERKALFDRCRAGATRILLTNPEMMIQPSVQEALRKCRVAHLVVDEAHVLPEWGGSFRPAYLEFARSASRLGARITSAFTATASPSIMERLVDSLYGGVAPHRVLAVPDRPNIHYSVRPVLSVRRELRRIAVEEARPMLIFCRSRAGAELTAGFLRGDLSDRRIRFYHAGLEPPEKNAIEKWFFDADDAILASTCAYGMGVDKPDIRTVVHAEVPESVEAYLQETGRAGRDGAPSAAIAVASAQLVLGRPSLTADDDPAPPVSAEEARRRVMRSYLAETSRCRRETLLAQLDAEGVDCSGCDVCDGNARGAPGELKAALTFFRRNALRYRAEEAIPFLARAIERRTGLRWLPDEVEEAISTLMKLRVVGTPRTRVGALLYGRSLAPRHDE